MDYELLIINEFFLIPDSIRNLQMKKAILLLILLNAVHSCYVVQDGIRVRVENNSDDAITEVKFFPSSSAKALPNCN